MRARFSRSLFLFTKFNNSIAGTRLRSFLRPPEPVGEVLFDIPVKMYEGED